MALKRMSISGRTHVELTEDKGDTTPVGTALRRLQGLHGSVGPGSRAGQMRRIGEREVDLNTCHPNGTAPPISSPSQTASCATNELKLDAILRQLEVHGSEKSGTRETRGETAKSEWKKELSDMEQRCVRRQLELRSVISKVG